MKPLADRIRPTSLETFVGQKHILSPDKILYKAIKSGQLFSMIFWGPPGSGKTTLARIIAKETRADFMEFSAVNTKIGELKNIFEDIRTSKMSSAKYLNRHSGEEAKRLTPESDFNTDSGQARVTKIEILPNKTSDSVVVFIDEIHRFSKSQQDAFLPYVERGDVTLIGATTENPSFEVISALLSRSRVFVLERLQKEDLKEILNRALKDSKEGLGSLKVVFEDDAEDFLLESCNGDSRILLNALEIAVASLSARTKEITKEIILDALQKRALKYDRAGEEHYDTISAFIKSMRASQIDAALYYLARMVDSGEDPLFIARRMVVFASEDIGLAQPTALVVANAVFRACETIGYPECQENLAAGVAYLCKCKKDRSAYDGYFRALEDVKKYGNLPIPMEIRNAPTVLMKELGYGKGYEKYTEQSLLPEKLKSAKYYQGN